MKNSIPTINQTTLITVLNKKFEQLKPILNSRIKAEAETQSRKNYRTNGTYMVWGGPGIGKTDIIETTARRHGFATSVFSLSLYDQVSLQGMPVIDDAKQRTTFYPNAEMPNGKDEPYGVLFLDEFSSATRAVQTAAMRLALEGRLGSYVLPPGWFVICAGNLGSEDGSETADMPTPAANRMTHFHLVPNIESFSEWGISAGINPLILAFLNFNPANLSNLSREMEEDEHGPAFASPRSWAALSAEIADLITPEGKVKNWELLDIYTSGTVGSRAGAEFMAFARLSENFKFNITDILDKANDIKLNGLSSEVRYYVFTGLAAIIKQRADAAGKKEKQVLADIRAYLKAAEPMEEELIATSIAILRNTLKGEYEHISDKIITVISDEFPALMDSLLNLQGRLRDEN